MEEAEAETFFRRGGPALLLAAAREVAALKCGGVLTLMKAAIFAGLDLAFRPAVFLGWASLATFA